MSRSYKAPIFTDQQQGRKSASSPSRASKAKRDANRAVRHTEDVANGKQYRKHSCSYNIRDWSWYCPDNKKARRK